MRLSQAPSVPPRNQFLPFALLSDPGDRKRCPPSSIQQPPTSQRWSFNLSTLSQDHASFPELQEDSQVARPPLLLIPHTWLTVTTASFQPHPDSAS